MARPKGSKNQKSIEWEAFGKLITEQGLSRLASILDNCDDQTFIRTYTQLLEYFKPKLKRLEVTPAESINQTITVQWDEPLQLKDKEKQ